MEPMRIRAAPSVNPLRMCCLLTKIGGHNSNEHAEVFVDCDLRTGIIYMRLRNMTESRPIARRCQVDSRVTEWGCSEIGTAHQDTLALFNQPSISSTLIWCPEGGSNSHSLARTGF